MEMFFESFLKFFLIYVSVLLFAYIGVGIKTLIDKKENVQN